MTRPNRGRNFEFEVWLAMQHDAKPEIIAELRRLEAEELEALALERGCATGPEPKPPSESWSSNITDSMVARAWSLRK